ncbi:MAG: ferritin family protein [bacterium]|nr:ferritin family protein [bacterium]MDT8395556.1 ferritin family protein [bacterium]
MDRKKAYGLYEAVMLGAELEDAGYAFYSRVAEIAVDYRVKNLFAHLADAEKEHKRVILEDIEPLFTPEWYREEDHQMMADYLHSVEKQPIFPSPDHAEEFAGATSDPVTAVDVGILAEERAIEYFGMLRDASQDQEGKDVFHRLHLEEIKHLQLLQDLKKEI